jgi:hypothetical protein
MLSNEALISIALFMALVLTSSVQGLAASGHFPRQRHASAFASGFGAMILFGSIALVILCLAAGIAAALHLIPWYGAIIGGGSSLLAAPPVLRMFPDRFVDGRGALIAFAAASAALAVSLIWMATRGGL